MEIEKIAALAKIMAKHGLVEVDLKENNDSVFLKRSAAGSGDPGGCPAAPPAPPAPAPAPAAEPERPAAEETAPPEKDAPVRITAPMPGTFYSSTSPENPPLVAIGDEVNENTVVCIVEAMKVMNEIKAETCGVVSRILVENGSPIEYGQPLFEIKPR